MFMQVALAIARHSFLGRGGARRLILKGIDRWAGGDRPIRTTYRGVPIFLHLDNTTERKALLTAYDRAEMNFLASHLRVEDSVFVDLGANSGLYTQWLASKMKPAGKIVCIEPNPEMRWRISANTALLRNPPQIEVLPYAISDYSGESRLDISRGFGPARLNTAGTPVEVRLLSACVESITALKADIEGHEDRALIPFFETAPPGNWPQGIVIETAHADLWKQDVLSYLRARGYVESGKTRSNTLLSRAPSPR
jgi:FkbM family methyltransferase